MARVLRAFLKVAAWIVGLLVVLVGISFVFFWYHNSYKSELQEVQVPHMGLSYVLMTDISGFEDPAWYVYELRSGDIRPPTLGVGHDSSDAIFWNYDEANDLVQDPHLTVVADRFLVLSRGGLRVSLYDMASRCVLVNDETPWSSYEEAGGDARFGPNGQSAWVKTTLDREIGNLLEPSNKPLEPTPPRCALRRGSRAR